MNPTNPIIDTERKSHVEQVLGDRLKPVGKLQQDSEEKRVVEELKVNIEYNFHKKGLDGIRKSLKGQCASIMHVSEKDDFYIKAVLNLPSEVAGKTYKKAFMFKLDSTPSKMNQTDYNHIFQQLKEKLNESRRS